MTGLFAKRNFVLFSALICLLAVFYAFNFQQVEASSGAVEFTSDVGLDLDGLNKTIYVAAGSKAESLTVGGNSLNVYGALASPDVFLLETKAPDPEHKLLQLTASGGTIDFSFSSAHVSSAGHLSQWTEQTETGSVEVTHVLGVSEAETYYIVKITYGETEEEIIVFSGAESEISFDRTGSGAEEKFVVEKITAPQVETLIAMNIFKENDVFRATLRGKLTDLGGVDLADVWFEWGIDENLISPEITLSQSQSATGNFSEDIFDLEEDAVYYFRAVAENPQEENLRGEGDIFSFITKEGLFITVTIEDKTRMIEVDSEGRIIIHKE